MATNQSMRMGIYEGILTIFFEASGTMSVGDALQLTSSGHVAKVSGSGSTVFGFAAQEVTAAGVADYAPGGLVSHTAASGDKVGVYIAGGIYWAKGAVTSSGVAVNASGLNVGDKLYLSKVTAGKLSKTANGAVVGVVIERGSATDYKFKSLVV
jgi:hypothetical protein